MEPQQILVESAKAGKRIHKGADHAGEGGKIACVPHLVVLGKESAVPEAVVEDGLVRVGHPEPEVGQPQALYRAHRVSEHGQGIEAQALKYRRRLFVHIDKALH